VSAPTTLAQYREQEKRFAEAREVCTAVLTPGASLSDVDAILECVREARNARAAQPAPRAAPSSPGAHNQRLREVSWDWYRTLPVALWTPHSDACKTADAHKCIRECPVRMAWEAAGCPAR
jgi:hypothetical protein